MAGALIRRGLLLAVLLVAIAFGQSACLSAVPAVPTTPAQANQVKACETDATVHNVSVISGVGLGAVGTGLGTAGSLTDDTKTQKTLADVGIGAGIVAAVAAVLTGLESSNYAQSGCPALLGPLPIAKPAPGEGQ